MPDMKIKRGTPDYICYQMGRNDTGQLKAAWESDTNYILDALHAKYPNAQIYISRLWYRGGAAFYTDLNAIWIPDVIAGRAYCHLGPDETTVLEGGDDGASRTVDGTHPNYEGSAQWAKAWKTAMGL